MYTIYRLYISYTTISPIHKPRSTSEKGAGEEGKGGKDYSISDTHSQIAQFNEERGGGGKRRGREGEGRGGGGGGGGGVWRK